MSEVFFQQSVSIINKIIKWEKILLIKLFLLTIIISYFVVFFSQITNFPYSDDFHAVLRFLIDSRESETFFDKFNLIFSQHNEHRIVYDRFWILLNYYVNSKINFIFLAFIGNLSLVLIGFLFYKYAKEKSIRDIYLVFVFLMIFNFTNWENEFFAMAALQNFSVIAFSMLSIYFITYSNINNKYFFYGAIVSFIIASFTSSSGLYLSLIGCLYFLINKKYDKLLIWGVIAVIVIGFYFLNYVHPPYHPKPLNALLNQPFDVFKFFLAFLASSLSGQSITLQFAIWIGLVFLMYYIYLFIIGFYKKSPFLFGVMTFLLITASTAALGRTEFGVHTALSSRYRIISCVLIASIYLSFFEFNSLKKYIKYITFPVLVLFFYISYTEFHYVIAHNKSVKKSLMAHKFGDDSFLTFWNKEDASGILKESKESKVFTVPDYSYRDFNKFAKEIDFISKQPAIGNAEYNIEKLHYEIDNKCLYIEGWTLNNEKKLVFDNVYFVIQDQAGQLRIFSTNRLYRSDLNSYFNTPGLEMGGFQSLIDISKFNTGVYKISLLVEENNALTLLLTDKEIHIKR